ncbi:unnamed protein product, partial [Sphenostylis stenocarpa]
MEALSEIVGQSELYVPNTQHPPSQFFPPSWPTNTNQCNARGTMILQHIIIIITITEQKQAAPTILSGLSRPCRPRVMYDLEDDVTRGCVFVVAFESCQKERDRSLSHIRR